MPKVDSGHLDTVDYLEDEGTLVIQFTKSSGAYFYYNVPMEVYHGLMGATSKSEFFRANIKDKFDYGKG